MDTVVVKGGKFTFTLAAKELARGLRPSKRMSRNSEYMTTCDGAVGMDGVLRTLDSINRIDTSVITDGFPFPQLFVFTRMIIVCGLLNIYEWNGSSLSLKYTAASVGGVWSAVDFVDYIYLTNGKIAVIRDAQTKTYALSSTQPHATAVCNFNGQAFLGAMDVDGLGASLTLAPTPPSLTLSILGSVATT